jgi:HK97 family phage prohead protease
MEKRMDVEKRTLVRPVELRAKDGARMAAGYAALFNSETDIGGYFREVIAPGAFADAIGGDVLALYDHDMGRVIGRSTAGTLRMTEDDTGLAVEIDLPDTTDGRDLTALMERGDIRGMSFGFMVTKETWDESAEPPLRTIQGVDLIEVSAVARPAYSDTTIALRSLTEARRTAKFSNVMGYLKRKATLQQRERHLD